MSTGKNLVILVGNLGKDPEVRQTKGGSSVASLSIAINERRKDGDEWKDHVEWVRVVCFGKTAEHAGQYLSKGRQVYVEGRMSTRSYKDKDGVEKWSTEVVAHQVIFLGSKDDAGGADRGSRGGRQERHRDSVDEEPRGRGRGRGREQEPDSFDDLDLIPF
jgi:single-strand DNA-binding protein